MELFVVRYKYDVGDLVELSRFLDSEMVIIVRRHIEYASSAFNVLKHVRGSDIVLNKIIPDLLLYEVYFNSGIKRTVKEREILKKVGKDAI